MRRQRAAFKAKKTDLVSRTGLELHQLICDLSGNSVIAELFSRMKGQYMIAISLIDAYTPDLSRVLSDHEKLLRRIDARDESGAVQLFTAHIHSLVRPVIQALGGNPERLL
jgi:DNA-binding GntR family transcriptional regulator